MTDSSKNNLASPDSLLGMLQRGRGKGYLATLEAAPETVWPLLFECITNDPQIDREWEDRTEYYASLMVATHMDFEPLHQYVVQNDGSDEGADPYIGLPLITLICLGDFVDNDEKKDAISQIVREYVTSRCSSADRRHRIVSYACSGSFLRASAILVLPRTGQLSDSPCSDLREGTLYAYQPAAHGLSSPVCGPPSSGLRGLSRGRLSYIPLRRCR